MHPDDPPPPPESVDAQFAQIVQQSYGPQVPQWHPQAYPQPYPQPYPPVMVRPRRRWGRWIALGAGIMAAVCLGLGAITVVVFQSLRDSNNLATGTSASPKPSPARSPREGDPLSVRQAWAQERILEVLDKQRAALLAGDEAGYLAGVDGAAAKADIDRLRLQYRSLRAMTVAGWRDMVTVNTEKETDLWRADVTSQACFVDTECQESRAVANTVWRIKGGTATLVEWMADDDRPHPWQTSELVAAAGQRTIVATVKSHSGKLAMLVAEAEKAALIADRFARPGKLPSRYVIYYAPSKEWKAWFDWNPPEWSGGAAIDVSDDRYELVLNADQLHSSAIDDLMRHELTHASSLVGRFRDGNDLWWLIEGIAELAEMEGAPASSHPGISSVRELAEDSNVKGLEVHGPARTAEDDKVAGLYGFAFLGVRCISERFGEAKLVEFFHRVVHDGRAASLATPEVLDIDWPTLQLDCLTYIKQTAG